MEITDDKLHIICITLENSYRHSHMLEKLSKIPNITYEFIFGKSFSDLSDWEYKKLSCWKLSQFSEQTNYLNRAYSCAESHIRANKRVLELDKPCLIIEDDIVLPNIIYDVYLSIIMNFSDSVYHLATEAYYYYIHEIDHLQDNLEFKYGSCFSAAAYITTPEFSKLYIKTNEGIKYPADYCFSAIPLYGGYIPIIFGSWVTFDEDQKQSTIGD